MNSRLLLIALLFAGTMVSAEPSIQFITEDNQLTIKCSDGQVITVPVQIMEAFDFFEGFIETFDHPKARVTPSQGENSVCSLNAECQFCLPCTSTVFRLLIDLIKTTTDYPLELTIQLESLSPRELISLIRAVKVLCLKEPFQAKLEELVSPILKKLSFIVNLHNIELEEIIADMYEMSWQNIILPEAPKALLMEDYLKDDCSKLFLIKKECCQTTFQYFENSREFFVYDVPTNEKGKYKRRSFFIKPDQRLFEPSDYSSRNGIVNFNSEKTLCAVECDYNVKVIDKSTGEIIFSVAHSSRIVSIDFSHNGTFLMTRSDDGIVKITNIQSGETIITRACPLQNVFVLEPMKIFTFSSDEKYGVVIVGEYDNRKIEVINLITGILCYTIDNANGLREIVLSPDGTLFAAMYYSDAVKIIELATGQTLCTITSYECQRMFAIGFSFDGELLVINNYCIPVSCIKAYTFFEKLFLQTLKAQNPHVTADELPQHLQEILTTIPHRLQKEFIRKPTLKEMVTKKVKSAYAYLSSFQPLFSKKHNLENPCCLQNDCLVDSQAKAATTHVEQAIDDNSIPIEDRCPSGEHNKKQGCCGCSYDESYKSKEGVLYDDSGSEEIFYNCQ